LRLDQKLVDGVAMTPKHVANAINTKPVLTQEFCSHFADSYDGTVTLDAMAGRL
jgi:hypothetical protein